MRTLLNMLAADGEHHQAATGCGSAAIAHAAILQHLCMAVAPRPPLWLVTLQSQRPSDELPGPATTLSRMHACTLPMFERTRSQHQVALYSILQHMASTSSLQKYTSTKRVTRTPAELLCSCSVVMASRACSFSACSLCSSSDVSMCGLLSELCSVLITDVMACAPCLVWLRICFRCAFSCSSVSCEAQVVMPCVCMTERRGAVRKIANCCVGARCYVYQNKARAVIRSMPMQTFRIRCASQNR